MVAKNLFRLFLRLAYGACKGWGLLVGVEGGWGEGLLMGGGGGESGDGDGPLRK